VAVTAGDLTVTVVDTKFRPLVAADIPTAINGVLFSVKVATGSTCASAFDVPASIGAWYDVMTFWTFTHVQPPDFWVRVDFAWIYSTQEKPY
jgi:hypothetical protein